MLRQRARDACSKSEGWPMARMRKRAVKAKPKAAKAAGRGRSGAARKRGAGRHESLAAMVRMLADRRAIEDGVICYGHAIDSRDYARLRDCMKPDVRVKYGAADWLIGADEAGRYCARALDPLDMSQHRFSSIDVKLEGDRATSTTYLCAEHVKNGERYTVGGHYLDKWERTPSGWRIAERQLVTTWTEGNPDVLRGVALE
jgi:ketosteroid isomerase-like protein